MKKNLEIKLSKLKQLDSYNLKNEQYQTDSKQAAEILWWAYQNGDIKDKVIADFGCGNGIFGVGAYLLGAKKVYFIDVDKEAIKTSKSNSKEGKFINKDVSEFKNKVDTVIMNPPFGVRTRKADKAFLESAMKCSKSIYSIHKIESKNFINKITKEFSFKVDNIQEMKFLLKRSQKFHKKDKYYVGVGCWNLRKI